MTVARSLVLREGQKRAIDTAQIAVAVSGRTQVPAGEGTQGNVDERMDNAGHRITVLICPGHMDRPGFARSRRQLAVIQPFELVQPIRRGDAGDRRKVPAEFVQRRQRIRAESWKAAVRRPCKYRPEAINVASHRGTRWFPIGSENGLYHLSSVVTSGKVSWKASITHTGMSAAGFIGTSRTGSDKGGHQRILSTSNLAT